MKTIVFAILFALLLIFSAEKGFAEHLVGGEISYECLGNNQYLVTLKIYRDCFSTGAEFDPNANMTIYQGSNLYDNTAWNGFQEFDIPIVASGPCFVNPPSLCLEMAVYERTVILPPSPAGYTIVHQRCCRGPEILNVANPTTQGNTYYIDIPPNDVPCNSSAEFADLPPATICVNEPLAFDHSASEPDGDELVYSLCSPLNGGDMFNPAPIPADPPPYTPISWAPGFSADDPVIANPQFSIDPNTGLLTGTPTQLGKYVVGICVSEFRDGQLLSTTRRDVQMNVIPCNPTLSADPGLSPDDEGGCTGLEFQFTNNSTNADDFLWDFGVDSDPEAVSTDFAPQYTYAENGTYEVTLIANPGEICADTAYLEVTAFPPVSVTIDSAEFVCDDGQFWSFAASGDFDPNQTTITWDFGGEVLQGDSTILNPSGVAYASPGIKTVSVNIEQFGCPGSDQTNVDVGEPIEAAIAPQTEFCDGLTVSFNNDSEGGSQYSWDFDDTGAESSIAQSTNAVHTFSAPGAYDIMLIADADDACADTTYETFQVYELLDPSFETPPVQCFEGNVFDFAAAGSFSAAAQFSWNFGDNASISESSSANPPPVSFNTTGAFPVSLTVSQDVCEETFTGVVQVHPEPVADFLAAQTVGCAPFQVGFTNASIAATDAIYQWDFGDGTTSNAAYPVHTYAQPGTYTVSLNMATYFGCVDTSQLVRPNYITVLAPPEAGFSFRPEELDIFNPETTLIDDSEGGISCYYVLPDSSVVEGCTPSLVFNEAGTFAVTQVVTNEDGCQDVSTEFITVLGHLFRAPNAFSPNGDGINDIFKPVVLGVTKYELRILNRMGEVMFETTDPTKGWDGGGPSGKFYLEPDVFIYKARVSDTRGLNYDYQGHVSIIR